MHNTDSEHASVGVTKEVMLNHSDKAGYSKMCHKGQNNYKTKNNRNVNKQKRKTEGQKIQYQQKDGGRPANRGGSHQTRATWRRGGWDSKNKNAKQVSKTLCQ